MEILFPVLIIASIALIAGIGLGLANRFMAVKGNPKAEAIEEALPGANCGACGFSGCKGYAQALAEGSAAPGLCPVGGEAVARKIGDLLGVAAEIGTPRVAVVHCRGTADCRKQKMVYEGISSCKAAMALYGGENACAYGCIGFGDCAAACDFGAISVCNGVAIVAEDACRACGKCKDACPKKIISMIPYRRVAVVSCSNEEKGAQTKAVCSVGCIGCRVCAKACDFGAISFRGGCAVVDGEKCVGCGKCVSACKFGVIRMMKEE